MFEDITIFQTTFTAVQAICKWITDLHAKQQKIRQLGQTVQALAIVLEPLRQPSPSMDLDKNVYAMLYDLLEILNGIKGHLSLWGGKTKKIKFVDVLGFLNPSIALGMLSDDEKKLSQWMSLFMLSLQIAMLKKQADAQMVEPSISETMTLTESWIPSNDDVSSFWLKQIGEDNVFVSSTKFIAALERWLLQDLDETIRNALLLELDTQDIGGVTRRALEGFSGNRTLKTCIEDLRLQCDDGIPASPTILLRNLVPTLVWTDDQMASIKVGLDYAMSLGIRVIQLPSTAITKLWVEQNEAEVRALEDSNLIHFITDNARWEIEQQENDKTEEISSHSSKGGGGPCLNMSAGESVLRYLRGHGYKAPVLVYCGLSVPLTQLAVVHANWAVTNGSEELARATSLHQARDMDDGYWESYGKQEGFNLVPR